MSEGSGAGAAAPLDLSRATTRELERAAERVLPENVFGFYATGSREERTLVENESAWDRWWLQPRRLSGSEEARLTTRLLGREVAHPVVVGPAAAHGWAHPDGELATARAVASLGGLMVLSTSSTVPIEEIAAVPGLELWFQLYAFEDEGFTDALIARAEAAGARALVVTVDVPSAIDPHARPVGGLVVPGSPPFAHHDGHSRLIRRLDWAAVARLANVSRLPLVLKGIVHPDDAVRAADEGIAAIVVSNHGGRTLDGSIPTAVALPQVAEAAAGRLEVYVDGGIRRGGDVLRALGLGADAAFIARPILWALALGGEEGVRTILGRFVRELRDDATFADVPDINDVPDDLVVNVAAAQAR